MTRHVSTALILAVVAHTCVADEPPEKVLIRQWFVLYASADPDTEAIGTYRINATQKGDHIKVYETVLLRIRDTGVILTSVVNYERGENGTPVATSGEAKTAVNGENAMAASFTIRGRELKLSTTIFQDRNGLLAEPIKRARMIDLPEGVVLLSGARAVIGPMLQPKPGEQPIVWIEFPDDIDEPINVKEGFKLAREATDDGGYTIHVRKGDRDPGPLPFDTKGRIKAHKLFDKYHMREKPIGV